MVESYTKSLPYRYYFNLYTLRLVNAQPHLCGIVLPLAYQLNCFITISTGDRTPIFREIDDPEIDLLSGGTVSP